MGRRVGLALGIVMAEFVAVILVFQVFTSFECRQTGVELACRALRGGALRGLSAVAAMTLLLALRPGLRRALGDLAARLPGRRLWIGVHLAGLVLIFLPWLISDAQVRRGDFAGFLVLLIFGTAVAALGGLLWLMQAGAWRAWLRQGGAGLVLLAALAGLIPDLAEVLGTAWSIERLQISTFYAVAVMLSLAGQQVFLHLGPPTIGTETFQVEVSAACSGIEGFALIFGFMVLYALLMRGMLRPGRYWLIVLPLALLASWVFNGVRIAVLILLGTYVSPELAVNGFHSFAGWLFFTLLALAVLAVVQNLRWLQRGSGGAAPEVATEAPQTAAPLPLTQDWTVASIVPFIIFMCSGLVVNSFWQAPALGFPLQAAMMAAALWVFRKPFLRLDWRLDPVALAAGALVGLAWVALAERGAQPLAGLETLGAAALLIWAAVRVLGTSLLVPLIEEAFFRGYLLARLDTGGWPMRLAAILVSTAAFALLHGRIVEAGAAGIVFALVMLRRNRLADAIVAHAVANATVAAAAVLSGDWSLI
ncbi:exosortase E/protease, VPEID-CTERM system [Pseudodonghicola flavimaris]|uniref:Exosortase E/protease, VPEID-CTERM system n=1 Tax=Pseudodonghicola flavimaris TaxID=3050036 RepID=A0ABT7F834_9RHOB|nr:exosortase E/protease, VPEID-CTERM system [Pseudodonghicola flavimaris]MDK3020519.1 exosortase E/protease, VPEID-CTERM system [Pseudodonghicola flavimaris]